MKIIISGKSGYLGTLISNELEKNNHEITGIQRNDLYGPIENLAKKLSGTDVIINLAGAPILQLWTKKNKKIIFDSRVKTTQNLVIAINTLPTKLQPKKFISASAVGIYKSGLLHNESSKNYDKGFVGHVVRKWEKPLQELPNGMQQNIFRIGLVVGKNAKTIKNLVLPVKLGLGATIGHGEQPFPFIHEQDVARAFAWAVNQHSKSGIYNLKSPENINHKNFVNTIAQKLNRRVFFTIPAALIQLVLGKASVLLTQSPQVSSQKIVDDGFQFNYPTLDSSLNEILNDKSIK